ncbi:MAG: diacylglycerol kinase family lipid kinase [Gemmatimonadota bacterium]|nr:diacylglycerol kinase family lipid kinase [Gemmatimonadota bacterium]
MPEFPAPDAERFLVLVNPRAAGGQPAALRRRIGGAMAARGVPFDIVETSTPEEGLRVVRTAAGRGYRAVLAAGGDGTIGLALRGTVGTDVPVGILPFGTGNQLALNFGIPTALEEAVAVAVEGDVERIDLGRIGGEPFALIAGAGLDAVVMADTTAELKSKFGVFAYFYAALKNAVSAKTSKYRVTADDQTIEVEAAMVLLANAGLIGAGNLPFEVQVAPGTSFQDGLLDVAIFAPRHLPDMASMLWKVALRRYSGDERMLFLQGRRIRVESDPPVAAQVDGEARGETPIEAEVDPQAGRILVPPRST